MSETVIVAMISLIGTVFGSGIGILASNKLTAYRIEQLEKKVDKHNSVVERTYQLEEKMKAADHRIEDLEKKVF
ncbi:MAG: hypothetical protein ACI4GA_03820 [Acutalibacteraceae bacterium]|nr:hypothetical protein [Oscillospiraceae bacterium]